MNNIESIKAGLAKSSAVEAVINPPQKKKRSGPSQLPSQKDIKVIEEIINEKFRNKTEIIKKNFLKIGKQHWASQINAIHAKALALRKEIEALSKTVQSTSTNTFKITTGYGVYWKNLPETLKEAQNEDWLELCDSGEIKKIKAIKKEIEDTMLDIKIGIKPVSDSKILLDKIDKLV